jgi:hypothetical protein
MTHKRKLLAMAGFVGMAFAASNANATLTFLGAQDFQGTGLGAVNTILTVQNTGSESGSVGLDTSGAQVITGDAKTGASQTLVRSLDDLGVTSAADLRVVFNANEPAGSGIDLNSLVLNIFSPTGTPLFSSGAFTAQSFADTFNGIGNAGFVFGLDATQAASAQASAFSGSFGGNLVGLSANLANAAGGPDTFFITNDKTPPVPEPSTYAMMGLGLAGLAWLRRKNVI